MPFQRFAIRTISDDEQLPTGEIGRGPGFEQQRHSFTVADTAGKDRLPGSMLLARRRQRNEIRFSEHAGDGDVSPAKDIPIEVVEHDEGVHLAVGAQLRMQPVDGGHDRGAGQAAAVTARAKGWPGRAAHALLAGRAVAQKRGGGADVAEIVESLNDWDSGAVRGPENAGTELGKGVMHVDKRRLKFGDFFLQTAVGAPGPEKPRHGQHLARARGILQRGVRGAKLFDRMAVRGKQAAFEFDDRILASPAWRVGVVHLQDA